MLLFFTRERSVQSFSVGQGHVPGACRNYRVRTNLQLEIATSLRSSQ